MANGESRGPEEEPGLNGSIDLGVETLRALIGSVGEYNGTKVEGIEFKNEAGEVVEVSQIVLTTRVPAWSVRVEKEAERPTYADRLEAFRQRSAILAAGLDPTFPDENSPD